MDSKLSLTSLRDKISSKMSESIKKSKGKEEKKNKTKEESREKHKRDKENKDRKDQRRENRDQKHDSRDKQDFRGDRREQSRNESRSSKDFKPREFKSNKPEVKAPAKVQDDELVGDLETLRREALALGASEEDLELLKGVEEGEESEQEFEDISNDQDQGFGSDLAKFMKGIGLDGGSEAIVIDDDEVPELEGEEDIEEEEEDEEEEDEEEEEEEEEQEEEEEEEEEDEEVEVTKEVAESSESESDEEEVQVSEAKVNNKKEKPQNPDKVTSTQLVSSNNLVIPPRTDWYNTPMSTIENPEKLDRFARERLLERATKTIEKDNQTYLKEFTSNSSQKKFLGQILADGTLNDKISALTLLVQESPLHNLKAFDTLLAYCEKKSRTASLQSINAFKDLLLNGLLPDRKLLSFENSARSKDLTDVEVSIYYFEDYLKKAYFKLISVLEVLSHDPILHVRMTVLSHIFDLLKHKPEQEFNLLRLGVNKLGDVDNKVCSKTSYQILQLQSHHPAMKKVIIDSIIDIIFKSNVDYNAKYYAVITLNQTILLRQDDELANQLIKTYFSLFENLLQSEAPPPGTGEDKIVGSSEFGRKNGRKNFKKGKKGGKSVKVVEKTEYEIIEEKNTKLFSALLTGLNRAFPFSSLPSEVFEEHLNTLFKITHSKNFNTSVQALGLIHHIISKQNLNSDRYFRTLYESLLDSRLIQSSKQGIYLNLLFKSLKNDVNVPRVLAFVKRILQVCSHWLNVGTISGMLFLLIELSKDIPEVQQMMLEIREKNEDEVKTEESEKDAETGLDASVYDPRKRDPKFANAENSSLWELSHFLKHYHPTVSLYAESLLDGTPQPKPDLGLYTLAHFLDRFVYKNSKQKVTTKGSSIMQPLGGVHTGSLLVKATNVMNSEVPANAENWTNMKIGDVRPDEQFFHQYFTTKISKLRGKKEDKDVPEDEEEAAEMEDQEVWQALVNSRPEIEAGSDSDDFDEADFDDMSDLEDDDEEVEVEGDEEEEEEFNEFDQELPKEDDDEEDAFDEEEGQMFGINEEDELSDSEVELKVAEGDDEDDDEDEEQESGKKRSKSAKNEKKSKKAKLKSLPLFASTDDYAQYLDSDDEDYS